MTKNPRFPQNSTSEQDEISKSLRHCESVLSTLVYLGRGTCTIDVASTWHGTHVYDHVLWFEIPQISWNICRHAVVGSTRRQGEQLEMDFLHAIWTWKHHHEIQLHVYNYPLRIIWKSLCLLEKKTLYFHKIDIRTERNIQIPVNVSSLLRLEYLPSRQDKPCVHVTSNSRLWPCLVIVLGDSFLKQLRSKWIIRNPTCAVVHVYGKPCGHATSLWLKFLEEVVEYCKCLCEPVWSLAWRRETSFHR